ncbi:MFS transporter [Streptomyces abikoensis]
MQPTTSAAMKPGMKSALASRALGSAAYYVISPFLAIWLHGTLGIPVGLAAAAVGVHLLSMRAGAVYMQFLVVRFRLRAVLVGGYAVAGAVMLLPAALGLDDAASWLAVLAVNGTAVSCANVGTKALIANGCDEETRLAAFGRLNAAINGGAALGPVAGGWLMSATGRAFPLIPAGVFAVAAVLAARSPGDVKATPPQRGAARFGLPSRQILLWSCVTATLWLAYAQFANVLPMYVGTSVSPRVISLLFLVNAVLIVLFQGVVARRMQSLAGRRGDPAVIALGMVLLAAGLVLFVPGRGRPGRSSSWARPSSPSPSSCGRPRPTASWPARPRGTASPPSASPGWCGASPNPRAAPWAPPWRAVRTVPGPAARRSS